MKSPRIVRFLAVLSCLFALGARAAVRVVVWDERQPEQKQVYSNFLGNAIADHLAKDHELQVTSVGLDDPEQGLPASLLESCDVLIWWGHKRNRDVKPELARRIVERVQAGKLALLALHSAHWAPPFVEAMNVRTLADAAKHVPEAERAHVTTNLVPGVLNRVPKRADPLTPRITYAKTGDAGVLTVHLPHCVFPAYRNDGKPAHVTVLLPDHPIAKGVPATFDLPQTEMYDEPFHVPAPDAMVFEEKWDLGERFRSGSVWQVGQGRVVYFRPGHETYPIFRQDIPLRIVANTVRWLGGLSP